MTLDLQLDPGRTVSVSVVDPDGKPVPGCRAFGMRTLPYWDLRPMDAATFRSLWNRVGNLDVFKRNRVRDANRQVDPAGTHVISIIFGDKENPQRVYFAVPADESDPQFLSWIKSLNIPTGSAGPPWSALVTRVVETVERIASPSDPPTC